MTLLTPEIAALEGETRSYTAPEAIGAAAFRYFADAIGDANPRFRDQAAARDAGFDDVVAPPTLICETNQYVNGEANEDGYAGHEWGIRVPGTRQIRGGNRYTFGQPVAPTDVITAVWRIDSVTERTTRSGAQLLVVESTATYTNQHGDHLATNTETIMFQEVV